MLFPISSISQLNKNNAIDIIIKNNVNIWTYTFDILRKAIVPINIPINFIELKDIPGYRIKLDNGLELLVDSATEILMRDGKYKNISKLIIEDSIMPFCLSSMGQPYGYPKIPQRSLMRRYEHVFQPWYSIWESVHRMVLREKLGRPIRNKHVCHHVDENIHNNEPSNLEEMSVLEHNKLNKKYLTSEPCRKKRIGASKKAAKKRWSIREYRDKHSNFMKLENERRKCDFEYKRKLSKNVSIGRQNMRNMKENLTVEEEIDLYKDTLKNYDTFNEAAKSLGMHPNTFRRRLRVHGLIEQKIPREDIAYINNPSLFERRTNELIDLMKKYITIKDAAKSLGIHPQTLSRKLSIYGIWDKLCQINNHKVVCVENTILSGIYASVDLSCNIGLLQGAFFK